MEKNILYEKIKEEHQKLYTHYSKEYEMRTKGAYNRYLLPFVKTFLENLKTKDILDLGCGPGRDLSYFKEKGYSPVGVDLSEGMVNLCEQKGLKVIKTDFMNLPFKNNNFGGVWAYTSLTLIPKEHFLQVIGKIAEILIKEEGVFALGMIDGKYEGWKTDSKYETHNRFILRMSATELHYILKKHFNTVNVQAVEDPDNPNRKYLHALCKHSLESSQPEEAAKKLFNKYALEYKRKTQSGVKLLEKDRQTFLSYIKPGGDILDLGSGPGRDSEIFQKSSYIPTAFDISEENIKICQSKKVKTVTGDICDVNKYFTPNSFDGVWANCSLTNWLPREKISNIIQQLLTITKKNGVIFIGSVVGNFSGWEVDEKYDQMPRYNNHWDITELKKILEESGLKNLIYERTITQQESGRKPYINLIFKI